MVEAVGTALGRIAASADPAPTRGLRSLEALRSAVPFDAAWLALADPGDHTYLPLADLDLDEDVADLLTGSAVAGDVPAAPGRDRLPVGRSDSSGPEARLPSWSDRLTRAGFHESLSVGLFARGGRLVGFLVLLFKSAASPSRSTRRRLAELAPVLALGIDPMPCLVATARVVPRVTAGTVLRADGSTEALLGVDGDALLAVDSPILSVASQRLDDGSLSSSFLWPLGGSFAPGGHARITVVAVPDDVPAALVAVVLISPPADLKGLTPRELEVLGLVIDGCSNQEIARTLVVTPRTVAAHIGNVLAKLDVRTRTKAAVRAEREGLYVPTIPGSLPERPGYGERALATARTPIALTSMGGPLLDRTRRPRP